MDKQLTFLEARNEETKYVPASGSPIYVPTGRRPHVLQLRDISRRNALARKIDASLEIGEISEEQARFLHDAAQRHVVFNYELIADYYANADEPMQRLMEDSALVIVDVDDAIERGYVRLCETVRRLHTEELADDE